MMFLKFCFWEKVCSVAFIESALPGHEYWGSALAAAVTLTFWGLGQMSEIIPCPAVDLCGGRTVSGGSCRARTETGLADSFPLCL